MNKLLAVVLLVIANAASAETIWGTKYALTRGIQKYESAQLFADGQVAWDETAQRNAEFIALANPANILALVEALEKAQAQSSKWLEAYHKAVSIGARYEEHIAELESRTVKLPQAVSAGGQGYQEQVERILTAAGIKVEAE